jgi:dipeptidyl aminopeptidase/acylaminoacyl peptidase
VPDSPFAAPASFTALPRITGLAISPAGDRLVATVQQPDRKGSRYASAIWEIPLDGASAPARLTRSEEGETAPAFLPGGELIFSSARPGGDKEESGGAPADQGAAGGGEPALWLLPRSGEPRLLATTPGGLSNPVVARDAGSVVAVGSRLAFGDEAGADAEADARARKDRKDRKITAILHTGMPIRYWDTELGDTSPRLFALDGGDTARDLTPDAGQALHQTSYSLSADGTVLLAQWRQRRSGGRFDYLLVRIDPGTGEHRTLLDEEGVGYHGPVVAPDGSRVAVSREVEGDFDTPIDARVQIRALDGGSVVDAALGDLYPTEYAWSTDSGTLFVAGDLHGRGAVVAVDPATGEITSRLVADASYSSLCPSPDGALYALRSAVDEAPAPVRLDPARRDQQPERLPTPAPTPELPGTLTEIETTGSGARLHGWLCRPHAAANAPLMVWIHGGPFGSWNSWSWRWNPWVAVAHGWAVLLPDPALSTGYGEVFIERAWPHRAGIVWRDVENMLDDVLDRFDLDRERVACLGASFGGYMTNWIAGHTDRFGAIVTHAGLWALDQQHTTTDGAQWKTGIFGTPADHPEWYAENSPHHFADKIATPMLVIHGNRDYRVPVTEALRLWWDLVRRYDGEPDTMPHRFLQLTGENHWVLSPGNARIWWETLLGFCDHHVRR